MSKEKEPNRIVARDQESGLRVEEQGKEFKLYQGENSIIKDNDKKAILDIFNAYKERFYREKEKKALEKKSSEIEEKAEGLSESGYEEKQNALDARQKDLEKQKAYTDYLYRAKREGKDPAAILNEWGQNPKLIPEDLSAVYGDDISNQLFYDLDQSLRSGDYVSKLEQRFEDSQIRSQKSLNDVLSIPEKTEEKEKNMVGAMTATDSYSNLFDTLTEKQKQSMTPESTQTLKNMENLKQVEELGKKHSDLFTDLSEDPEYMAWVKDSPTYAKAKQEWETSYKPYFKYDAQDPFEAQEANLAALGHMPGSSSQFRNIERRDKRITAEDLLGQGRVFEMMSKEHLGKGETLKLLNAIGEGFRVPAQETAKLSSEVMGKSLSDQRKVDYDKNVFQKDLTQGELEQINQELQQNVMVDKAKEDQRQEEINMHQNVIDQIYQLQMLSGDFKKLEGEDLVNRNMKMQNMWAQRTSLYSTLESIGMTEEAAILRGIRDRNTWTEKVQQYGPTILRLAAATGLAVSGNWVGAGMVVAPDAAAGLGNIKTPKFGESAKSSSTTETKNKT